MKMPPTAFTALLNALSIETIQPMRLASERIGDSPSGGCEVQIEYRQAFADGDPVLDQSGKLAFRMKCELIVSCGGKPFFTHETICIVIATITDKAAFDTAWADPEIRVLFLDAQIKKTIWPFFREHVHSAMSRLGMSPVVLPWLL